MTEFGSDLSRAAYDREDPDPSDGGAVNSLRGLGQGLRELAAEGRGVAGVYYWHGWDNGDSYSFWGAKNSRGAAEVQAIERDS